MSMNSYFSKTEVALMAIKPGNHLGRIETKAGVVTLRDDGIMHYHIKRVSDFTRKDVEDLMAAAGQVGGGKKYKNIITLDAATFPDTAAREFAASEESNAYTLADAYVIKTLAHRLMARVFEKINKPVAPTAFFSTEEEAIAWLNSLSL